MTSIRELLQQPFVIRSLIVVLAVSLVFPLYGNMVLIRRQANIAHTFAHMGLLGVAVAMLFSRPVFPTVIGAMILTVIGLILLGKTHPDSHDATNEILAQVWLVGAIIIASQLTGYRADLSSYLFGDIVLITQSDLWQIIVIGLILMVVYRRAYRYRLQSSLDPLMARTRQSYPLRYDILYLMMLGLLIAWSIKIIGVLLVSAFLILPSNIARLWSGSLRRRQWLAIIIALVASLIAMLLALGLDVPLGAMIVAVLIVTYGVSVMISR